jgi:deoxycitidine kinase/deoxyguanosine kinase
MNNNILVSIEGNIGSGKTTLLENLKNKYKNNNKIVFLKEPVDEWSKIKDESNKTILENYYLDPKTYAFPFQMMAYISRLSILKRAIESGKYKYIITERCLNTDRKVFCKMLYDDGFIEKIGYDIYNKWFDEFNQFQNIEYFHIYIRTNPITSKLRVDKRARKEETIPIEYLEKCHKYHDEWLYKLETTDNYVILIDGNVDIITNPEILDTWYDKFELILTIP